ncbi:proprotein convertase P-domain-containing protein [Wenzhouxiangella marina]|uniref:Uncharacterized protein n=1 Tax=Wenzhouxiangella marina TaxID=1579979 RepID=A0A0K0XYN9_9GAMM|nr:proprotein convertase P-domain-containing protein [Wenzhouxiangella marina]AKS42809.1 hypothetical protein WM2015_2448 [Wenzhouxiangella marina]MBB6087512.1 subtilisin-like proprotein convertase family protein [Wenzhouxiangella marina]
MSLKTLSAFLLIAGLSSSVLAGTVPGDPDPSFGNNGWVELPFSVLPNARVTGLHVDIDNSILVVGTARPAGESWYLGAVECFAVRLLPNGSLDPSFGSSGVSRFLASDEGGDSGRCEASVLLPDGALIVSGDYGPGGLSVRFARVLANGDLDLDFAPGGIYNAPLLPSTNGPILSRATLLASGELAAMGRVDIYGGYAWTFDSVDSSRPSRFDVRQTRLSSGLLEGLDGRLDGLFFYRAQAFDWSADLLQEQGGSPLSSSNRFIGTDLVRQPDGRMLASLSSFADGVNPPPRELAAGRFLGDGTQDLTYTSGASAAIGQALIRIEDRGYWADTERYQSSIALHPSGRSIQVSTVREAADRFERWGALAVRRSNGGAESTFAVGGVALLRSQPGSTTELQAVAVAGNGNLLAGGFRRVGDERRPVIVRLLDDDNWSATWDTLPDFVSLPAQSAAPRSQWVVSAPIPISGLDNGVRVPVITLGGQYRINAGPWLRGPGWVVNGDVVELRHFTPSTGGQQTGTVAQIGGVHDPRNARRPVGTAQLFTFTSVTEDPLPGGKCSEDALCNHGQAIPDNNPSSPAVAFINQIGSCPFVTSVRVGVDVSHSYVGDLQIILDPPNSPPFSLINRPNQATGGCSADDILVTFEAGNYPEAQTQCGQLGEGLRALDGTLRPALGFSSVIGSNGQGAWSLSVSDFAGQDTGTLNDWSLDIQCSNTPPELADLSIATSQPTNLIAGDPRVWQVTVTNNGPARVQTGQFNGGTSFDPVTGFPELTNMLWSCSVPAGSSCSLPPGCAGPFCAGSSFQAGLDLAAGATATIELFGTPEPFKALGEEVGFEARVDVMPSIFGTVDPDTGDNAVTYRRDVVVAQDLAITDAQAVIIGNEVEVSFRLVNNGPSAELGSAVVDIQMPAGYVAATSSSCSRGASSCTGLLEQTGSSPIIWRLSNVTMAPGGAAERVRVRAAFTGAAPPTGNGSIQLILSGAVNDFDSSNDYVALSPVAVGDQIFADRFQ